MNAFNLLKRVFSSPFRGTRGGILIALLLTSTTIMAKDLRTAVFKVEQMHCENCVKKINSNIRFEKGLKSFDTDLKTKTVTITYDADKTNVEKLKDGFKKFNYKAEFVKESKKEEKKEEKK